MRKPRTILSLVLLTVTALALGACAPAATAPDATHTVSAIYTSAANTFTAQEATKIASTPPTPVPSQTSAPSPAPTTGAAATGLPVTGGTAAATCNNSIYINDATIPDGTVIAPNNTFTKTWTVKNTGTCSWTTAYKLIFLTGEAMGGTSAPVTTAVPAGAQTQISVKLTAPATQGNYTGSWQLEDAQGNRFGEIITVVIVVNSAGGAATATP